MYKLKFEKESELCKMIDLQAIFKEIEKHLLEDSRPSDYLNSLLEKKEISQQYPFTLLNDLKRINQNLRYHPEGNVWNHTILVVDHAAIRRESSSDSRIFMWAALLHDIGKLTTTKVKNGRITAYNHDQIGQNLTKDFLKSFEVQEDFIEKVSSLVRWHMQILYVVKNLPFANIKKMLSETNLNDVSLLSLCDRLGRGNMTESMISEEEKNLKIFIEKCNK